MKFTPILAALAIAALASAAHAATDLEIASDTYIDSYPGTTYSSGGTPITVPPNANVNYGGSAATKVVHSGGSGNYPDNPSAVHTLITLPTAFWTAIGSSTDVQVSINFRIRNFNNSSPATFTDPVAIFPLTHAFTAGTGVVYNTPGNPASGPSTMGGTTNTPGNPVGADWATYDGANAWTSPGGDYDSLNGAAGIAGASTSALSPDETSADTYLSFNISDLIDNLLPDGVTPNPVDTRDEIKNFGLLAMISDDTTPIAAGTQQFLSLYSIEGAGSTLASQPEVVFSTPEPASLGLLVFGAAAALFHRRRKDA